MVYGVSWYPEQKAPDELEQDLELLHESGFDAVRMGEFAWSRLEPEEGRYEFGWLDDAVERLGARDIRSIICTPTACPPIWLVEKYPDMMYVDNRGRTRPFGGRRHYCYTHTGYRDHCAVIAEKIGERYGRNPLVLGFQLDNEPAQESTGRCRCPRCRREFQDWLEDRYGSIETLNREMGTVFWSQEYRRFRQIPLPLNSIEPGTGEPINAYFDNPSLHLDFQRFCSDAQIDFQNVQADVLRRCTTKPVTTNGTGVATNSIDYRRSYDGLDVYAFDYYPDLRHDAVSSFPYAFGRGIKGGDFWLMEFSSGGGHSLRGRGRLQPLPGALEQAAVHAGACGASLLAHFQFRTFPHGAEQLNYAVVDADGVPRRRFREVHRTSRILKQLSPHLEASVLLSRIAMVFDYDSLWALAIKPPQKETFEYPGFCSGMHDEMSYRGYGCDVIGPDSNFLQYDVLILPALIICTDDMIAAVRRFVEQGGTVIATFLTSVKNAVNAGRVHSLPAGLTDLFGIIATEVEPVTDRSREEILFVDGTVRRNQHWAEELELHGAEPRARYSAPWRGGAAAVSRHRFGKGWAYYIGTGFGSGDMAEVVSTILRAHRVSAAPFSWNGRLECIHRTDSDGDLFFLFNFEESEMDVTCPSGLIDPLTGDGVGEKLTIDPRGWKLVRRIC